MKSISNQPAVSAGTKPSPANGEASYGGTDQRKRERRKGSDRRAGGCHKRDKPSTVAPNVVVDAWRF